MTDDPTPRWEYRFRSFAAAVVRLRTAIGQLEEPGAGQLAMDGTVRRFETAVELGGRVLRDFLEHEGACIPTPTPRAVIRKAFATNLIADGSVWMDALTARIRARHAYDLERASEILGEVRTLYLPAMEDLRDFLGGQSTSDRGGPLGGEAADPPRPGRCATPD